MRATITQRSGLNLGGQEGLARLASQGETGAAVTRLLRQPADTDGQALQQPVRLFKLSYF